MATFWSRVKAEIGLTALLSASRDVYFILLTRFIRMLAYGSSTLVLAIFFSRLGFSDTAIGAFLALTLVGDVVISLLLTLVADALGRRNILMLGALLMTASGVVFALSSNYWILLLAAVVGVISSSGNEIGPFRAIEESTLAHLAEPEARSDIFAYYVVVANIGLGIGAFVGGWTTQALQKRGASEMSAFRVIFWAYAAIGLLKAASTLLLSSRCEADAPALERQSSPEAPITTDQQTTGDQEEAPLLSAPPERPAKKSKFAQISPESRQTLLKLCSLFFFDSLGSGMMPNSLIVLYISRKFHASEGLLGTALGIAIIASSIGNIFASALGKRIGLIRAMVATHLPAAVLLAILPALPTFFLTVVFLVVRAIMASMDQAPRTAFLSAVVQPSERTAVMGIVNTIKTMSQSSGPFITGLLAGHEYFWVAFVLAGSCKISYDLGLLAFFGRARVDPNR